MPVIFAKTTRKTGAELTLNQRHGIVNGVIDHIIELDELNSTDEQEGEEGSTAMYTEDLTGFNYSTLRKHKFLLVCFIIIVPIEKEGVFYLHIYNMCLT